MFEKTLEVNFTDVGTIEIQDDGEKVDVVLQLGECDSLAAAIENGVNFWIDDDGRQFGFSHWIVYVSASFVVLGSEKSMRLALALKSRGSLKVQGT